jgi:catechol 2,3-dioxygenase-like lactoylglutathione lyase family enzyme
MPHLALVAILVDDYDKAIEYYTQKLDFILKEDTQINKHKRWVVVQPPGASECGLLLAKAANGHQIETIGNQSGGRVFLFLHTEDFERDYTKFLDRGVHFIQTPHKEPYGTVAVFKDLYGNLWDLIQPI